MNPVDKTIESKILNGSSGPRRCLPEDLLQFNTSEHLPPSSRTRTGSDDVAQSVADHELALRYATASQISTQEGKTTKQHALVRSTKHTH